MLGFASLESEPSFVDGKPLLGFMDGGSMVGCMDGGPLLGFMDGGSMVGCMDGGSMTVTPLLLFYTLLPVDSEHSSALVSRQPLS